ncbi:hypothetical protein LguiA_023522 [Lonicera macranthoides]
MEELIKAKEEKLNSIIMELRNNYATLQEKFANEELDKCRPGLDRSSSDSKSSKRKES